MVNKFDKTRKMQKAIQKARTLENLIEACQKVKGLSGQNQQTLTSA